MSLVNCPECKNEISNKAEMCPNCGYPISKDDEIMNVNNKSEKEKNENHVLGWIVFTITLIMAIILFFTSIRSGFYMIMSSICICPNFVKYIKNKTNKEMKLIVIVLLWLSFFIVSLLYIPSEEKINTNSSSNVEVKKVVKVEIPDFSLMEKNNIVNWCKANNISCKFKEEYSDNVEKGLFIKQSISANKIVNENSTITIVYSLGKAPTMGEINALGKAEAYLSFSGFSKKGLKEQLEFEGFSEVEAQYAVDNCGADWNEQAAIKAKAYLSFSSFSRSGLKEQLEFEGFTKEQAEYGVKAVGY